MERRLLYFYNKNHNYDEIIAFLNMYENISFSKVQSNVLIAYSDITMTIDDFAKLREFILEEILVDFVGLFVPKNLDISLDDLIIGFKKVNYRVYSIEDFITEICLEKVSLLQVKLKSYYYNLIGVENINTVVGFIENNFNASQTSKKIFLHRNTLNYRLENFINKTEIDIKKFKNGLAIYLLFKR
jgi:hypothetical protein